MRAFVRAVISEREGKRGERDFSCALAIIKCIYNKVLDFPEIKSYDINFVKI